jgi:cytochrome P450
VATTAVLWLISAPVRPTAPAPPAVPVIGNLLQFLEMLTSPRVFDKFVEYADRLAPDGRTWQLTVPRLPLSGSGHLYVLNSPECVDHMLLGNFANYVKGPRLHYVFREFFGKGIFASDGAVWKVHRKIASHMFSRRLLQLGTGVATRNAARLLSCLQVAAGRDQAVDAKDLFFRFTMDTFTSIAFGLDLGSLEVAATGTGTGTATGGDAAAATEEVENVLAMVPQHKFATAFDIVQRDIFLRFGDPLWQMKRVLWFVPSRETNIRTQVKVINEFCYGVIAGRRRDMTQATTTGQQQEKQRVIGGDLAGVGAVAQSAPAPAPAAVAEATAAEAAAEAAAAADTAGSAANGGVVRRVDDDELADERMDLLTRYVASVQKFDRGPEGGNGPATDEELRDLLINFLTAGE